MREIVHTDEKGRKFMVRLPDHAGEDQSHLGIPIGPPDIVDELELPEPLATRLHNILFDMKLWSLAEVKRQRGALFGAWQRALNVDVQKLQELYFKYDQEA